MKKILVGILVLIFAGFVGLAVQSPVQHELNMWRDPIYATAYNDVVPLGYSMDEACAIVGNEYYSEAKLLVEGHDYTFEEAFDIRLSYHVAVEIEKVLPGFDVLFVELQYSDIAIFGSLNLDLTIEGMTRREMVNTIITAVQKVYPDRSFSTIYLIFGFDPLNKAEVNMQFQCVYNRPELCLVTPIRGELYDDYMPWKGSNTPLTSE